MMLLYSVTHVNARITSNQSTDLNGDDQQKFVRKDWDAQKAAYAQHKADALCKLNYADWKKTQASASAHWCMIFALFAEAHRQNPTHVTKARYVLLYKAFVAQQTRINEQKLEDPYEGNLAHISIHRLFNPTPLTDAELNCGVERVRLQKK